ncbi:MAG TPA: hypothetical protein VMQ40_06495 [Acidimicrobiales bacterium]|jgi:hypothetical protein|nr:hypothetical protein [Acidimicrobiales bacterium]
MSCLSSIVLQFGGNPADLGFLAAKHSLLAEFVAWGFFVIALLFALLSADLRGSSPFVPAGVAVCVVGALLECASVGFSVRILAYANPPLTLYKAEFSLAALGWLFLALGVLIVQRNWAEARPGHQSATHPAASAARRTWQRTLLVVALALLCSAGGATFGLGSFVEWQRSRSQAVLLSSYVPQVLTWMAVAAAALIVVNAARRDQLPRRLAIPAGLAVAGGVVLTVSTASLLTAVELVYRFFTYGWVTPLIRVETVGACVGMLAFAGACVAAAAARGDPGSGHSSIPAAPPYWPRVATQTS